MNVSMNGRKVSHICWVLGAENSEEIARSDQHGHLELVATYHGDHDEFWIAKIRQDGMEVRRFNCKYLSYIAWEEPAQNSGGKDSVLGEHCEGSK